MDTPDASVQPFVQRRYTRVDFLALPGRFVIVVGGEGSAPGEVVADAVACLSRLIETMREDLDDEDTGWILAELEDGYNWKYDEGDQPYWFAVDIGEISQLHVIRVR